MRVYAIAGVYLNLIIVATAFAADTNTVPRSITLASTTSVDNSGFYDYILPKFSAETGIQVRVLAVGTGRALNIASKGDADIVIVHDEKSELEFIAQGHGVGRKIFMYNYYILVGDKEDSANIVAMENICQALQKIAQSRAPFISRGDESGTHKKERSLWQLAGIEINSQQDWYIETGNSMGATLNMANHMHAYTLTDSATWINFKNRSNLKALVQNDPPLINRYSAMLVNPAKHPNVHYAEAKIFADWLVHGDGAQWIERFRLQGVQLFNFFSP